jgi:hypothetical protein
MLVARRNIGFSLTVTKGKDDYRGRQKLRRMNYKAHRIEVSVHAAGDSNGWVPDILVSYSEQGKGILKSFEWIRPLPPLIRLNKPGSHSRKSG